MDVHFEFDRALWRRFKSHCSARGETLVARIRGLIERDLAGG